jgi:sRNA-binding carbon storage regulator CsrA
MGSKDGMGRLLVTRKHLETLVIGDPANPVAVITVRLKPTNRHQVQLEVLAARALPVHRGEIAARAVGCAVDKPVKNRGQPVGIPVGCAADHPPKQGVKPCRLRDRLSIDRPTDRPPTAQSTAVDRVQVVVGPPLIRGPRVVYPPTDSTTTTVVSDKSSE